MVSSMQLAMEKVAPEMAVWIRFCRCTLRNCLNSVMGMRETRMANSAPTSEVLGVVPVLTISSMPMIQPNTHMTMLKISTVGSQSLGCSLTEIVSCS